MKLTHTCIRASAGSGKTFQLAHRYIRLLALGVPAERIMAMTFSRAAAGEIFDSIIDYVSQGAASDAGALERNRHVFGAAVDATPLSRTEYLRLLRELLQAMHRLHIGTLDSFTVGILKSFPMELGIPPQFAVMDENSYEAQQARQQVLDGLFYDQGVSREAREAFLLSFKESTFGVDEKNLHRTLNEFIEKNQSRWAELPDAEAWGNPERIFPEGSPWLLEPGNVREAVKDLYDWLEEADLPKPIIDTLQQFAAEVSAFDEQSAWSSKAMGKLPLKSLGEELPLLLAKNWPVKHRSATGTISGKGAEAILSLLHRVMHILLQRSLKQTQGLGRLLEWYDGLYDKQVRRAGRLSFTDTQYLLHPLCPTRKGDEPNRLFIDYRLDATLDHWLWDEFQDTSDLQWDVLSGLLDEAIQDAEEQRSVFYVGDTKQAIYGWRGGNPRLFQRFLDKYPGRFEEIPLHESRRTPPAILEVVNQVFSSLDRFAFPAAALERWNPFPEHRSAVKTHEGYVALVEPPCPDKDGKPDEAERFEVCAQLLRDIDPAGRGLSVGILTRSNNVASRLANHLRGAGLNLPIAHEGATVLADNAAVALMLALVEVAAHPGDTFAWQHLLMSPLQEQIVCDTGGAPVVVNSAQAGRLCHLLLNTIQNSGLHGLIKTWSEKLRTSELSLFEIQRLRQLEECALSFDATGSRDLNTFLEVVRTTQVAAASSDSPVRIMTVHKSKGLGFDVVILPELMSTRGSMTKPSMPNTIKGENWMLRMPQKFVQEMDPTLSKIAEAELADQSFEEICNLYVAMTRSKQALYCISSWPGATTTNENAAYVLKHILCDGEVNPFTEESPCTTLYEHGDSKWLKNLPIKTPVPQAAAQPAARWTLRDEEPELPSPSQMDRETESAAALLGGTRDTLDFGTAVHSLFEQIDWLEPRRGQRPRPTGASTSCRAGALTPPETTIEKALSHWLQTYDAPLALKEEAMAHFRSALESEDLHTLLTKPEAPCQVWKEKAFSLQVDGKMLNGVMDRVHLYEQHAEIIDYKTNRVAGEAEVAKAAAHYQPQLAAYARVLNTLTGIPVESIELKLVFTRPGIVVSV